MPPKEKGCLPPKEKGCLPPKEKGCLPPTEASLVFCCCRHLLMLPLPQPPPTPAAAAAAVPCPSPAPVPCPCPCCCCCPQELRRQDPQLLQQIQANQGEFMRMVMEPGEGEGGDEDMAELLQAMAGGAGGAGGLPPGMVQVGGAVVWVVVWVVLVSCAWVVLVTCAWVVLVSCAWVVLVSCAWVVRVHAHGVFKTFLAPDAFSRAAEPADQAYRAVVDAAAIQQPLLMLPIDHDTRHLNTTLAPCAFSRAAAAVPADRAHRG
jgi:hypothetical protein